MIFHSIQKHDDELEENDVEDAFKVLDEDDDAPEDGAPAAKTDDTEDEEEDENLLEEDADEVETDSFDDKDPL